MDAVLALALAPDLADAINVDLEEATEILTDLGDDGVFQDGRAEYLLLSDADADAQCREQILNSLCYFRPAFLASHADVPVKAMEAIQGCDDHDAVARFLERLGVLDDVINDAIASDGRGHFLSSYDSNETKIGSNFYLYRTN